MLTKDGQQNGKSCPKMVHIMVRSRSNDGNRDGRSRANDGKIVQRMAGVD